jgi:uncharacterized glyoxalase superfamily protein PhnB
LAELKLRGYDDLMTERMIYNMQPLLQVRDLRESIDFYTDVLGFRVDSQWPEDAPTWCSMHSGNARLMMSAFDGVDAAALTGVIYMYPDSVEEAWERLKDVCDVDQPLFTTAYGMREFVIHDPSGYHIAFGESTNEEAQDHEHPDPHARGD